MEVRQFGQFVISPRIVVVVGYDDATMASSFFEFRLVVQKRAEDSGSHM